MTRLAQVTAAAFSGPSSVGPGRGLAAVESAIRAAMTALGGRLLQGLLDGDAGHTGPRIDCGHGHRAAFVGYRTKTVDTVLGPIGLRRAWYHCAACHHGHAPRDVQLGVADTSVSPGLQAMLDRAGAALPFGQAADLLADLAGVTVTGKRVERAAEAGGTAATAARNARARAILSRHVIPLPPAAPVPDMLYLAVDGTGVPMTAAETAGRTGKGPDGRARTREAKLAALFTQTSIDDHGRPVRDPASTSYLATLEPVAHFTKLLVAAARDRGSDHIRQLVVLGDGAHWIWNLAGTHFPAATQIVDLFHAREHLHELADHLAFITYQPEQWKADRLAELDAGDIDAIITAASAYDLEEHQAKQRAKDLTYFTTNAHRMRYAHFRDLGMFVGSGVVEAGCKAVIGARLKQSGMRWTSRGATAITTLRCQHATGDHAHTGAA